MTSCAKAQPPPQPTPEVPMGTQVAARVSLHSHLGQEAHSGHSLVALGGRPDPRQRLKPCRGRGQLDRVQTGALLTMVGGLQEGCGLAWGGGHRGEQGQEPGLLTIERGSRNLCQSEVQMCFRQQVSAVAAALGVSRPEAPDLPTCRPASKQPEQDPPSRNLSIYCGAVLTAAGWCPEPA